MPLTRTQKEKTVTELQDNIKSATSVVFIGFDGLTVSEVSELRDKLNTEDSHMRVMPKRLLKIVMDKTKLDFKPHKYEGQIAVIWGSDAVSPAKVLHTFATDNEHIKLLAGTLNGNALSLDEVTSLAKLPGREELLGQLVGVLSGPARGLASVLSGVQRSTVYVLQAITETKS